MSFYDKLDERQAKEADFALLYAKDFAHGTDGHNRLLLIARLVGFLREYETPTIANDVVIEVESATVKPPRKKA